MENDKYFKNQINVYIISISTSDSVGAPALTDFEEIAATKQCVRQLEKAKTRF